MIRLSTTKNSSFSRNSWPSPSSFSRSSSHSLPFYSRSMRFGHKLQEHVDKLESTGTFDRCGPCAYVDYKGMKAMIAKNCSLEDFLEK